MFLWSAPPLYFSCGNYCMSMWCAFCLNAYVSVVCLLPKCVSLPWCAFCPRCLYVFLCMLFYVFCICDSAVVCDAGERALKETNIRICICDCYPNSKKHEPKELRRGQPKVRGSLDICFWFQPFLRFYWCTDMWFVLWWKGMGFWWSLVPTPGIFTDGLVRTSGLVGWSASDEGK